MPRRNNYLNTSIVKWSVVNRMRDRQDKDKLPNKTWEWIDRLLKITQIVLFIFAIIQFRTFLRQDRSNTYQQSAQFMLDFNKQLRGKDGYQQLIQDISVDSPIFKCHSVMEIDNYLTLWELLDDVYRNKLIESEGIYTAFSYDIQKTYNNTEIRDFIAQVRKDEHDTTLYSGLEHLAKIFNR